MAESGAIVLGLRESEREVAALLYWEAFGGKLATVMGPEARALAYVQRVMRADHCFAAHDRHGNLIGIAGFKSPQGSFAGGGMADMRAVYGWFGALWRGLALRLLANDVDNHRFLIDGIAVTAAARGRGVGQALLQALYREGIRRGYREIRLEVVEGNWRAQALYRREGFVLHHVERLGLLRFVFGFDAAITMLRSLERHD